MLSRNQPVGHNIYNITGGQVDAVQEVQVKIRECEFAYHGVRTGFIPAHEVNKVRAQAESGKPFGVAYGDIVDDHLVISRPKWNGPPEPPGIIFYLLPFSPNNVAVAKSESNDNVYPLLGGVQKHVGSCQYSSHWAQLPFGSSTPIKGEILVVPVEFAVDAAHAEQRWVVTTEAVLAGVPNTPSWMVRLERLYNNQQVVYS